MLMRVYATRATALVRCSARRLWPPPTAARAVVARHRVTGDHSGSTGSGGGAGGEKLPAADHLAVHHRHYRLDAFDLLFRHAEIVLRQHRHIRQLADLDLAFLALFGGEPWRCACVHSISAVSRSSRALSSYIAMPPTVRPETSQYSAVHG